jgi:hypothetical protein
MMAGFLNKHGNIWRTVFALLLSTCSTTLYADCNGRSFSSFEQTVLSAYVAFYGRPADPGGLAFWSGRLESEGGNLNSIIDAFATSAEYESRFGSLSNTQLVTNLFQQLFGRDPDPEGLDFYVSSLNSGVRTLQSISLDILYGAQNEDTLIVNNRVDLAAYYIHALEDSAATDLSIEADALSSLIVSVNDTGDSATSACLEVDSLVDERNTSDSGSWTSSGGLNETSADNPRYKLELSTTQTLVIDLQSETDNYLFLLDADGNIVVENDDRDFSSFNARIEITLDAGIYYVVVATYDPGETDDFDIDVDTDGDRGALNLRAIAGTDFVDYTSLGGHVTDALTGAIIANAEITVFGLVGGFTDVTVFSDSSGEYFLRLFADRLALNTFNAMATADGCEASAAFFSPVDADNDATIDFALECAAGGDPDPDPGGGDLYVELSSGVCTITQINDFTFEFSLSANGTASGSVDTRFIFEWLENPGIYIEDCGAWTFREGQQDCMRGPDDPATTTWSGGDAVNLPRASVNFNDPRQITPFVNRGGALGSTHPANLELDIFTISCQ